MRSLCVFSAILISVSADPIIIRSGVSEHKDEGKIQDANVYGLSSAKGVTNYEGADGFDVGNEGKHVQAQDTGKYDEENAQKKVHSNEDKFADDKYHQSQGGEVADFNKKSANKKGHHKAGFSKSYRKDESANTSSFYDDSDNEGNEYIQNNKKNLYGDAGQHTQRGQALDDRRYAQDQGKHGYYNNAGNYDRDLGSRRDYNSKRYHDVHENEGRRNAADRYDDYGRYGQEKYLKKEPHYRHYEPEPDPYYSAPKRTITIYEDPRYDGHEKYPPSYDNDYVQLEVKRPPRDYDYRYYERRPTYDYYY